MSHIYTPVDVALTTLTLPDDLEGNGAATVNLPFKSVSDGIKHLSLQRRVVYQDWFASTDLGIHLIKGTTDSDSVAFLTPSTTTLSGDLVEVELSAWGTFNYTGSSAATAGLNGYIRANQNGGGATYIVGSQRLLEKDVVVSSSIATSIHLKGMLSITTPGTLAIDTYWAFVDTPTTGDSALVKEFTCLIRVWRG